MSQSDANLISRQNTTGPLTFIEEKINRPGFDPLIRKYAKGKFLGKGGFAKCYEVIDMESNKILAAKIISKSTLTKSRAKAKLVSEIKIHRSLKHDNIVNFEHVFEDSENVYILLELCTNQSLHDLLKKRKRLTELETQCYALQIIQALKHLQSRRIIHRDLKLGNLFLNDKMELKLGDFGLAAKLEYDGERRRTVCGTPNYIAPEIIDGKAGHSYEVDTWSLGVILYTLLVGKPPFETADVKLTYKRIKACSYSFPELSSISDEAKHLIGKLLSLDPYKRPSLDDIIHHPFFRNAQHVPKTLPVSTLTTAPTNTYLNQHSSSDNIVHLALNPQKSLETVPLSISKPGKYLNTGRNRVLSTEVTATNTPTSIYNNENIRSVTNFEKRISHVELRGFNYSKPSYLSGTVSVESLGDVGRPNTVQKRDFKSVERIKTSHGLGSMGNVLRVPGSSGGPSQGNFTGASQGVWIKKWIDYSSKYGLGYLLSNGDAGVFFNDNSKMIFNPKTTKFEYIERSKFDKQEITTTYLLTDYPKELQKKVTLLQHFRNYLESSEKKSIEKDDNKEDGDSSVYVKRWVKAKNATMFRLSNKIIQVSFDDKTEIILNSESKTVTYVNKKGERNSFPLTNALENGNSELAKRMKFTKELLSSMFNGQPVGQIPTLNL